MAGLVRALAFGVGVVLALGTLRSAIRTVVLPRSEVVSLTRAVFLGLRKVFDVLAKDKRSYDARDRVMAFYAPLGLMLLAASWALCEILAFTLVSWGLGVDSLQQAFVPQRIVVHDARLCTAPGHADGRRRSRRGRHRPRIGRVADLVCCQFGQRFNGVN